MVTRDEIDVADGAGVGNPLRLGTYPNAFFAHM